jgi:hypothetical protein
MAVWDFAARLWTIARKVEEVLALQVKTRATVEQIEVRLRGIEDRMIHLEASRGQLIIEARAAAGVAATGLAGSVLSDVVTRVTRVEMQQGQLQRLPPHRPDHAPGHGLTA